MDLHKRVGKERSYADEADALREDRLVETLKTAVNGSKEPKEKALSLAVAQIERQFGKGAIMRLGAQPTALDIAVISTGAISLDAALGVGGIPRGRVTEIFGPEASGKTTIALHLIAEVQQTGGIAAFIDAEHALDPVYAQKLGVKTDELLISQPDTGEQALEIAETLVRSGAIDVIVVDSVAALVPKAEIDGEMGDAQMGLQARLMSQALAETDRHHQQVQDVHDLHQSAAAEDRHVCGQPRNHHRRQCPEILCLRPPGCPAHQPDQRWGRDDRQPRTGQGGEEQSGPAVPPGGV